MHAWENHVYAVALGPAALRVIRGLPGDGRQGLSDALRRELDDGPHTAIEVRFDSTMWNDGGPVDAEEVYTATPLSFCGYTAIHRLMTSTEIERLGQRNESSAAGRRGFYVIDLIAPESAFRRWPRLAQS
jgi:hypothetical protein